MDKVEETIENTDEALAERVKKGDKEAFGEIVKRYEDKLIRYARKFMSDRQDINDLIQEVFIKAYVNILSFDSSRKFSPWIYRIAHNEFVNAIKKKITQKIFSVDFDVFFPHLESHEKADKQTEDFLNEQILDKYLNTLDQKHREPLVLYFYEEMDYKEIADILQIPTSTVGVRISRAKEKLKDLLGKEYDQKI